MIHWKQKLGLNGLCGCESGKKHKKCCVNISPQERNNPFQKEESEPIGFLTNPTGELYMPVRLFYEIYDLKKLLERLESLKCVKFLSSKEFVFYYTDEAKFINLEVKKEEFSRISSLLRLACGFTWEEKEMILDVNCFERAIDMVNFIDEQISRDIIRVTHAVSCNKVAVLYESDKNSPIPMQKIALSHYEELFSEAPYLDFNDFVGVMNDLARNRKKYEGEHTYEKRLYDIAEKMLYPLPATTQFPVHFYEQGSMPLTMNLFIRRMVAIYSQENDEYTPLDAFIEFTNFIEASYEKRGTIH